MSTPTPDPIRVRGYGIWRYKRGCADCSRAEGHSVPEGTLLTFDRDRGEWGHFDDGVSCSPLCAWHPAVATFGIPRDGAEDFLCVLCNSNVVPPGVHEVMGHRGICCLCARCPTTEEEASYALYEDLRRVMDRMRHLEDKGLTRGQRVRLELTDIDPQRYQNK